MEISLSDEEKTKLTKWSDKIKNARGSDLEPHTNSLSEDTYHVDSGIFNSTFYWPDGHDGPVEGLTYLKELSPTEQKLISQIEEKTELEYLAHGVGRITFTLKSNSEYIVKFGRWGLELIMGNGVQVNQSEYRFYQHTSQILSDSPLLPITLIGEKNGWILQRKVTTYEEYDAPDKPDFESLLQNINTRLGPFACLVTDKTPNNIGYVNGRWYLFDYGQRL